jgi:ketosteroid isomerase-like protein
LPVSFPFRDGKVTRFDEFTDTAQFAEAVSD